MLAAHRNGIAGNRNIQRFLLETLFFLTSRQFAGALVDPILDLAAQRIDLLSDNGALFGAQLAHALEQRGQFTLAAQHRYAQLLDVRGLRRLVQPLAHRLADVIEFVLHDVSSLTVKNLPNIWV